MAGLNDKLFVLNFKKGLEKLRQRHIEAIVHKRFTIVGEPKLDCSIKRRDPAQ